jgi:hypothetical protein
MTFFASTLLVLALSACGSPAQVTSLPSATSTPSYTPARIIELMGCRLMPQETTTPQPNAEAATCLLGDQPVSMQRIGPSRDQWLSQVDEKQGIYCRPFSDVWAICAFDQGTLATAMKNLGG